MIFVVPRIHKPRNKRAIYDKEAFNAFEGVDLILYMIEATDKTVR